MKSSDSEYRKIITERLEEIKKELERLKIRNNGSNKTDKRILGLKLEEKALKAQLNPATREAMDWFKEHQLSRIDARYDKFDEKQRELEHRKKELTTLRNSLSTSAEKRSANSKIRKIEAKINVMKNRKVLCGTAQRMIMYPKYRRDLKRQRIVKQAEGQVEYGEKRIADNEKWIASVGADSVKGMGYRIKGVFYRKNVERSKKILEELKKEQSEGRSLITMYLGSRGIFLVERDERRERSI